MISPQNPLGSFMLFVMAREGGFTNDEKDSGNWTGGKVGVGELKGSKYGISAAAYPALDIATLTPAQAERIYLNDYWIASGADKFSAKIAFALADAAVQHGSTQAAKFLQRAARVMPDGIVGPATVNAVRAGDADKILDDSIAERIAFYMQLPPEKTKAFGRGWAARIVLLCKEIYS